jgi:Peptidase family M23
MPSPQSTLWPARAPRLLGAVALSGLLACSPSEPVPPEPPQPVTSLTLRFSHVIDGKPIQIGQTYTTRYGQQVTFDHLRYWVSNVVVLHEGQKTAVPGSYYLVEQTPEHDKLSLTLHGIPAGSYDTLVFHLGVDPPHNAGSAPAEGELAPGLGMDWTPAPGYQFFTTEGRFQQQELTGKFSFHTGTDVLYKELTAALPSPVVLAVDKDVEIAVEAEVDRIFAGVQLATEATITGGTVDSPAAKVAGNYSRMFRLVTGDTRLPLTATSPNIDGPIDTGPTPTDSTPPLLSVPILDLTGSLFCAQVPARPKEEERACVTPFQLLPQSGAPFDAGLLTFVTKNGEAVHASAPGVVTDITYLEHSMLTHSDLFSISVRSSPDSAYWMEYRNLKNLEVAEGDTVKAGQILARAGDYFDASVGLVAFGVRRQQELTQRLCPTRFTTPEVESLYRAGLDTSNPAWPAYAHDDLCSGASLLCTGGQCEVPADFEASDGDIDEGRRIYKEGCALCHGSKGEGGVAVKLCSGPSCKCTSCTSHPTLAARIGKDMPPEGYCDPKCAADVAAFILHEFAAP